MTAQYEFPWQYNFPPFFTLQTHEETRRRQLDAWCDLILSYARENGIFVLTVPDCEKQAPFVNPTISRRLPSDGVLTVLEELKRRGRILWIQGNSTGRRSCYVLWRTIEEWARVLAESIRQRGSLTAVCTLYELTDGSDAHDELRGVPKSLLLLIIQHLEKQGKAALVGNDGVKFSL